MYDYEDLFKRISKRYNNVGPEALESVLCPVLIPIKSLDKKVYKLKGQSHYRASFEIDIRPEWTQLMQRGVTGKFVPESLASGGVWQEICKGRITDVDPGRKVARGEIYVGNSSKSALQQALMNLNDRDFLEIDQYGSSAKILSALSEYYLAKQILDAGYIVRRMPEDTAKHLGSYYNYDFEFEKMDEIRKVEVKSLWGTDTTKARLIHSKTSKPAGDPDTWSVQQKKAYYPTSSCKFETQDIFAVSLFLRTGNISDFAFAKSVSIMYDERGLPFAPKFPEHVHQNPPCVIGNGAWFGSIDEVWN